MANKKWRIGTIKENIKVTKTKIKYLKHVIKQHTERKTLNLEALNRRRESNKIRQERLPLFAEKSDKMRKFVEKFVADMQSMKEESICSISQLRQHQCQWILQLHDVIFPVDHVESRDTCQQDVDHDTDKMMIDVLADAMRTSYISGKWVSSDQHDDSDQYRIVSSVRHESPDMAHHNIAAAHTLAAQFTSLAASALQLPLPVKLVWSDLGVIETSEVKLAKKVFKLNLNMIRLCLECGLDICNVRPTQCLQNMFNLILTLKSGNTIRSPMSDDEYQLLDVLQAKLDTEIQNCGDDVDSDDNTDDVWSPGVGGGEEAGWESVNTDQVVTMHQLSSGPVHTSIASSVSNTVSQFLGWAQYNTSPHQSPQTNKK